MISPVLALAALLGLAHVGNAASFGIHNVTYNIFDEGWAFNDAPPGYQQGVASYDGTLPSKYSEFGKVWYSNAPQALAIFTPGSSNSAFRFLSSSFLAPH